MRTPLEVVELVQGSGNNFHAKVARWFQSQGWHTTVSPYYLDQSQGKAREIDLIVEKAWPIKDWMGQWKGDLVARLFVECKFVPQHAAFWFADKDISSARSLVCSGGVFRENNSCSNEHHYVSHSARVAKLFASNSQKGQELEPFYKALNQVLNAMVSMRQRPVHLPEVRRHGASAVLNFPVVVCSSFSTLWSVDFFAETDPVPICDNFQLEVRYAYADSDGRSRNDFFLIDFVEFEQLAKFEKLICKDADAALQMLCQD